MPLSPIPGTSEALAVSNSAVPLVNGAAGGSAAAATYAVVQVLAQTIRYTRDGVTPTASLGTQAPANVFIILSSDNEIRNFKAIRESSDATLQITYYSGKLTPGEDVIKQKTA